jgi:hypothetical protein
MPSAKGLPPRKWLRTSTERDVRGSAGGVLAAATATSGGEWSPPIGTAVLAGSAPLGDGDRRVFARRGDRPNNQNGAAYHCATFARFHRPIPSPGSPRTSIPA